MNERFLQIPLNHIEPGLTLAIYPEGRSDFRVIDALDAEENAESMYQILEGNTYEYHFSKGDYQLDCAVSNIIIPSRRHRASGRIVPNIYVGTLSLDILSDKAILFREKINLEVIATKFNLEPDKSYRNNYRFMLESITDKCTELLMQINTPVYQTFEIDYESDRGTVYQRFCFVQSMINNPVFTESVHKIISNPKTSWDQESEQTDIRRVKRLTAHTVRQVISGTCRMNLPSEHPVHACGVSSVPLKVNSFRKIESTDTPENRFIKYVLETFQRFCEECLAVFKRYQMTKPLEEAHHLVKKLESFISHPFFREINIPDSLKLNSPVLQKRSGYREILNRWLQFDFASKLVWKGGDDVYAAGKKDIASLYEYWIFFVLYDLVKDKFDIETLSYDEKAYNHLIVETADGLNLMLKSGKHIALEGTFTRRSRDLAVKFSYNRTFKGGTRYQDKVSGSWTAPLRPDYTLSIWPAVFTEKQAEANESVVHIHFDAKYKIDNFYQTQTFDMDAAELEDSLNETDLDERKGNYKNGDLLKMHAYKDAIRRSGGAYILYPGKTDTSFRGFHEIIPGLGAFSLNPSSESDVKELSGFIDKVIEHLLDRTSQREQLSDETNRIFEEPKTDYDVLHERIPEIVDSEKLFADKTFVIVGYYKDQKHLDWIIKHNLYNLRTGTDKGSFALTKENMDAKYLVLHGKNELETSRIYKLKSAGAKVYSVNDLRRKDYPEPKGEFYLVYEIEGDAASDFDRLKFNLRELAKFETHRSSAKPFTVTLAELLSSKT